MQACCEYCGTLLPSAGRGLARRWCSERCRSRFRRKGGRTGRRLRLVEPGEGPPAPAPDLSDLHCEAAEWVSGVIAARKPSTVDLRVLLEAGEALSRAMQARDVVRREGLTIPGLHGDRIHPCVVVERDSRSSFVRIAKGLLEPMIGPVEAPKGLSVLNNEWDPDAWERYYKKHGR